MYIVCILFPTGNFPNSLYVFFPELMCVTVLTFRSVGVMVLNCSVRG
jgi:hypothetical protein